MGARKTVLAGIEAFQNDQNWIEIRLPASNQWRSAIESLPSQQRARIQSPEFYELIRREISKRALLLLQSGGPSEAPPPR
jgi:predicted membrane-bound spermidine synthase